MEGVSSSGVEHLRMIFDLCDTDRDGIITADDFRLIGHEHFGKTQQVDLLIHEMDPDKTGHITFAMFCQGVQAYLIETRHQSSSSSRCSSFASTGTNGEELSSPGDYDSSTFSGDDVYPFSGGNHSYLSNGYDGSIVSSTGQSTTVELVVDPGEEDWKRPLHSTPKVQEVNIIAGPTDHSPSSMARQLLKRHSQLGLPETPNSYGSTPAEIAEEEVLILSDQLQELSTKLEDLEADQKDSDGFRHRLKRENFELKIRLEECEEQLRDTETVSQHLLNQSQDQLKTTVTKIRRESEMFLDDIKSKLQSSTEHLNKLQDTEATLRNQLALSEEECDRKAAEIASLEEREREVQVELRRAREELKLEREKWDAEREGYKQDVQDRDHQLHQLKCEWEEVHRDRKRNSITASDMSREIEKLTKEIDCLQRENEGFQAQFLHQGEELLKRNTHSLAAEMENASKEEVVKVLQDTEEHNIRLQTYIEGLLVTIIERHPEMLEKH